MRSGNLVANLRVISFWLGVFILSLTGCSWLLFVGGVIVDGTTGASAIFWGLFEITVVVGLAGFLLIRVGRR